MKKGVKKALIVAAGCMGAGLILMGAGRAAGGYTQLDHILPWYGNVHIHRGFLGIPYISGMNSMPGIGMLENTFDRVGDIWSDGMDNYADKWDDWADRWADRFSDQVEQKVEAQMDGWADELDRVLDEDWEDKWDDGSFYDEDSYKGGASSWYDGSEEEAGQEVYNGDFETDIAYTGLLEKLSVEIGVHGMEIKEGAGNNVHLEGRNCDRIQCYVKNGTLYVRDVGKKKKFLRTNNRKLTLTVPTGMQWEEASLEADMSYIKTNDILAKKVTLDADMGSVEIKNLTADKVETDADMGGIAVKNMKAGTLSMDADMGSIQLAGIVDGDIYADADMGSIVLRLHQKKTDYNYDITSSMGNVQVGNTSYTSLDKQKVIDNGADKKMELDSSMGSIEIFFK